MKLPRVAPRKEEVAAIVEILESGEYENETKMARAIVAKAYELMLDRDWYFIAEHNEGHNVCYGLFATQNAAIKAMPSVGVGGLTGVFVTRSLSDRRVALDKLDENKRSTVCMTCGHQQAAHEFPRTRGACVGLNCGCGAFVQEGAAA